MTNQPNPDARCARFAATQRGLITLDQARQRGWTDNQVKLRARDGELIRLAQSVYRFAAAPVTWQQSALAAVLAAPDGARCSHLTSAALLVASDPPLLPHITVAPGCSARTPLAKVHRSSLDPADI
jgi:hypothetical protein